MNSNKGPSKEEVMGWSPQTLADYMRKLNLPGCDKVVMKRSISGAQFIHMTECDLQVFPSIYVPIITKIHSDISKREQKWCFGNRSKGQTHPKQVFAQDEDQWDSDESDNDNDDYEGPDEEGDNYINTQTEQPTAEEEDSDETYEVDFEPQPSPRRLKPPTHPKPMIPQDCHSRDPVHYPPPTTRTLKPPHPIPPRTNHIFQLPPRAPAGPPNPHIDRSLKPGQSSPSHKDFPKSEGSTVMAPGSSSGKYCPPTAPKPTAVCSKMTKLTPAPPVPTQRTKVCNPKPRPRKSHTLSTFRRETADGDVVKKNTTTGTFMANCFQDLDPSWYGGQLTRHQAEAILREVNKDGAFVVRDSSKGSVEHPYTLMLLKDDKVYNIKIRNQGNVYSLGTGLNNSQTFPGVTEMITHHALTPLLLIDATDLNAEVHNQSRLLYPAGL